MSDFVRDLRLAGRQLLRQPGSTLIAVAALALGIGFTATLFSIVRGTILRPLPFAEPEELVALGNRSSSGELAQGMTLREFRDLEAQASTFEHLVAFQTFFTFVTPVGDGGEPTAATESFLGAYVTGNMFEMLAARPLLGRGIERADEDPGVPLVAVLSFKAWQRQFGADRGVLGKSIKFNRQMATVIGVMPEGFGFPYRQELWLPLRLQAGSTPEGSPWILALGRLAEGISTAEARTELATIGARLTRQYDQPQERGELFLEPLVHAYTQAQTRTTFSRLMAAVAALLLVACANVANLLLARAARRAQEIAVRTALGASRSRIAAQWLTESLVLASLGGGLGLALAAAGIRLFNSFRGDTGLVAFWIDVRFDPVVLAFVVSLVLATSILAGLLPALRTAAIEPNEVLNDASRGSSSLRLGRFSRALVLVQVALSCVLLTGSGLMARGLLDLAGATDDVAADNVLTARLSIQQADDSDSESQLRYFNELERRLGVLPGVESVALGTPLPYGYFFSEPRSYAVEGETYVSPEEQPKALWHVVSTDYFATFDIPLTDGRAFNTSDRAETGAVVIVNQDFARRHFPDERAVGRRIRLDEPKGEEAVSPGGDSRGEKTVWATIVGLVPDVTTTPGNDQPPAALYAPLAQHPRPNLHLAVRATGAPLAFLPLVRREVAAIDRHAVVYGETETLATTLKRRYWSARMVGLVLVVFGVAAILLAAIGLYGVMSFAVRQRTREMGVRMALGARPSEVLAFVLGRGLRLIALGLLLGLGAAAFGGRFLESLLVGVPSWDAAIYAVVAVTLLGAGLLACWLPARRASRVDPMTALHYE